MAASLAPARPSRNRHIEDMPQSGNRVVVSSRGGQLAETARPFIAIHLGNAPKLPTLEARPAFLQRDNDLFPIVPSGRLDRDVISLVLLVDLERFTEGHLRGRRAQAVDLLLAMLTQELSETRFGHREMSSAKAFPNLFVVVECARIIAAGLMTQQILLSRLFPSFHGFVLVCSRGVENDRERD